MVRIRPVQIIALLVAVDAASAFVISNRTDDNELNNNTITLNNTRRRNKKDRSTSSSSGERDGSSGSDDKDVDSLNMSDTGGSTSDSKEKKRKEPKSSVERRGWRKWHRKCTPCHGDIAMKWRDPNIKWICGAYQRARRSFKSECMMYFRNCQDGTMFVKIHDHRCQNSSSQETRPWGNHFFYDYKVEISGDSSETDETSADTTDDSSSNSS